MVVASRRAPVATGERDFHGEKRFNQTHVSTTDPQAKLYRKSNGQPSRQAYMGQAPCIHEVKCHAPSSIFNRTTLLDGLATSIGARCG